MRPDDLAVLPLKTTSQIALGVVTGGYQFRADADAGKQHVVSVDWRETDVPRTAVEKDLLYSLGSSLTVGLLRRWLPKGTDLNIGPVRLAIIEDHLNTMPRKLHDWHSAHSVYAELTCIHR